MSLNTNREELDYQIISDSIGFLDKCFDNTFSLQNSLKAVKKLTDDLEAETNYCSKSGKKQSIQKTFSLTQNNNTKKITQNSQKYHSLTQQNGLSAKCLRSWGLPNDIVHNYGQKGIINMFEWQVECLGNSKVLLDCGNLVYSAPTSAGKTLVAEILAVKTVLERQKKVIFILPFVSVVREKMLYFQQIFSSAGVRVEGFMGSHAPPGGFQSVHIAICTIEKANSLVNKLMDEGNIAELGALIVDEMHLLGDSSRGYILELLLTKIKYVTTNTDSVQIQIIGMSATLPNLNELSKWLNAELYITDFRPIPLSEYCLVGNKVIDKNKSVVRTIPENKELKSEGDSIMEICIETIKEGCSVLIFCTTKNWCENLAQLIATTFFRLGSAGNETGKILRKQLNTELIVEVLEQLKNCPVGLDHVLKNTISFGVAYHHAGLTFDERDIVEGGFKNGAIRILIATSTLSSGVNLPARRVVIRSPVFQKQPLNILTYKQMIGRAGRMGKDVKGESFLICSESEKKIGYELMAGILDPVVSCIENGDRYMRAILEVIASKVASTKEELDLYTRCTLRYSQTDIDLSQKFILEETLKQLIDFELIRVQEKQDCKQFYSATPLGKACLSSSMAPNDGLTLFCELQKARQCLVLETELHLIYLVTPYSVSGQWGEIDWLHLLNLWESLTKAMRRVGELVGVQESFIFRCVRGNGKIANAQSKIQIHKRFYTALALQDLVNEVPLSEVASKFRCSRGLLQSLQQSAATFAGMVTAFSHQLGWKSIEMLVSQFQDRLHFGIHSELLELMRLPSLNGLRARSVFNAGFETICSLASADVNSVENALYMAMPFQSEKDRDGEDKTDTLKRNKVKNIWISGHSGMTAKDAATNLITEARMHLQHEMGVTEIKWKNLEDSVSKPKVVSQESLQLENSPTLQKTEVMNKEENVTISKVEIKLSDISVNKPPHKLSTFDSSLRIIENKIEEINSPQEPSIAEVKELNEIIIGAAENINTPDLDGLIWDSLIIDRSKENSFKQIYNLRKSDFDILSPCKSLVKSEPESKSQDLGNDKNSSSEQSNEVKDLSLFSSDGSCIFNDSLPVDTQLCQLVDRKEDIDLIKNTKVSKMSSLGDTNSIINAFASTFTIDDDCDDNKDLKLFYDDEKPVFSDDSSSNITDEEIESSQESTYREKITSSRLRNSCTSALKGMHCKTKLKGEPSAKKIKLGFGNRAVSEFKSNDNCFSINIVNVQDNKQKKPIVSVDNKLTCIVVTEGTCMDFCTYMSSKNCASLFLNVQSIARPTNSLIGCNIVKRVNEKVVRDKELKASKNVVGKGIALYFDKEHCYYIDTDVLKEYLHVVIKKLEIWLKKICVSLKVHCAKLDYVYMKRHFGLQLQKVSEDTSIMEWLIDSDILEVSIETLVSKYVVANTSCYNSDLKFQENFKFLKVETVSQTCINAWSVWMVAEKQKMYLQKQYGLYQRVLGTEVETARILGENEFHGVNVDTKLASTLLTDVKQSQEHLRAKAYMICGHRFNFNSSQEVARALGIYNGRKVSTKKSVLTAHNSPLSSVVIYWRKLNAILTKTLYPLTAKAVLYSEENRIHPSYVTHTCTGRICMQEPNIQNVPRTFSIPAGYLSQEHTSVTENAGDVIEFNCRNIFKANIGWVIVSADYCQLEMRILTHMCGDKVLMEIMNSDVDVFRSIGASWSGLPEKEVNDELRQQSKQLCYGIIYGMGIRTLSKQLDVSEMEAAVFMDTFHRTYPAIKIFTQKVISECREKGFIDTLMNRRRYFPAINSTKVTEKNVAERQAVNTVIQGSAADIAKAAMCAVNQQVAESFMGVRARLLLQMHDELIYEVPQAQRDVFIGLLKTCMEKTVQLNVPLPVKVKSGNAWGSLEEVHFSGRTKMKL